MSSTVHAVFLCVVVMSTTRGSGSRDLFSLCQAVLEPCVNNFYEFDHAMPDMSGCTAHVQDKCNVRNVQRSTQLCAQWKTCVTMASNGMGFDGVAPSTSHTLFRACQEELYTCKNSSSHLSDLDPNAGMGECYAHIQDEAVCSPYNMSQKCIDWSICVGMATAGFPYPDEETVDESETELTTVRTSGTFIPTCKIAIDNCVQKRASNIYEFTGCMAYLKGDGICTVPSCSEYEKRVQKMKCDAEVSTLDQALLKVTDECHKTLVSCLVSSPTVRRLLGEEKRCEALGYSFGQEDFEMCLTGLPSSNCTDAEYLKLNQSACVKNNEEGTEQSTEIATGGVSSYPGLSQACKTFIDDCLNRDTAFEYLNSDVAWCMSIATRTCDAPNTICTRSDVSPLIDIQTKCESITHKFGKELLKLPDTCVATVDPCLAGETTVRRLLGEEKYCAAMTFWFDQKNAQSCLAENPLSACRFAAQQQTLRRAACSGDPLNSGVTINLGEVTGAVCCFLLLLMKMAA